MLKRIVKGIEMKKTYKFLLAASGLLGLAAAANHMIFKNSASLPDKGSYRLYNWRHGGIKYTASGSGAPLLLLHSLYPGASSAEWNRVVSRLSAKYKVYTFDFLGYGYSDKPNITYSSYLCVTLINDFIDDVIGKPAYVAGSAQSAAFAAAGRQLRPKLYKKIILISPLGFDAQVYSPTAHDKLLGLLVSLPVIGTSLYNLSVSRFGLSGFFDKQGVRSVTDAAAVKNITSDLYKAAHFGGASSRFSFGALVSGHFNVGLMKRLQETDGLVCVLFGNENRIVPFEQLLSSKNTPKTASVHTIKKSGLFPHIDRPNEFCKIVERFIIAD